MSNKKTQLIVEPTIVEVRRFIFQQMQRLEKGEISIHEGIAQSKMAHQIMDGYKTQVRLLEVAGLESLKPEDVKRLTGSMDSTDVRIIK